jgi:bifunctional oligoribonuclease and PAP phosphatase NrnA
MRQDYAKMIEFLKTQHNLLICGHEQPDGDCLGSMLAVYDVFDGESKNWRIVIADAIPQNLKFLPGLEMAIKPEEIDIEVEAVLILDGRGLHRTGQWLAPYLPGRKVYCVDHHLGSHFEGEHIVLEPEASATAEIITAIIEEAGIEPGPKAAMNLYSGIVADTGCFRFLNTTSRCFTQAAKLLPKVDIEEVRIHLFEDCSMANLRLKGHCCTTMELDCNGLLCYAVVDRETIARYGGGSEDLNDIVNFTLMPHGVKLGILFEEHEGFVKLGLRSRSGTNVNRLARALGGGGHELAAGARIKGSLSEVIPRVIDEAKELLAK